MHRPDPDRPQAQAPEGSSSATLDEAGLRRLLRHLPGMAYVCRNDEHWTMEFVSQGCRALTGFDPVDLVHNRVVSYAQLIDPDDSARVGPLVARALDERVPFRVTYRIRRADGEERWVWEQGAGVADDSGAVSTVEGFITDITEQVELERRSEESHRLYRALAEQTLTGVFVVRDADLVYANPRLLELYGIEPHEARADTLRDRLFAGDYARVRAAFEALLEGRSRVERVEFRMRRGDGMSIDLLAQMNAILLDDGPACVGVVLDVTERRRAERRYQQAQRMEQLGELAAGVAHDFNNVLSVIKTGAQMALLCETLDDSAREDLGSILAAVDGGSALARQLTVFGRVDAPRTERLRVEHEIKALLPVLERLVGRTVTFEFRAEDGLAPVDIDPSHLEQVVVNLVVNARDAVAARRPTEPPEGRVRVRVRPSAGGHPDGPSVRLHAPHVVLEVEDDGAGIEAHVLGRIFEPYFTTKGDQGTGLGLGNVWRIARGVDGWVDVDSEPGRGTTFRVYLPAAPTAG